MTRQEAKNALDRLLKKSRAHLYKPIQIAEILYHKRMIDPSIDLLNLESYRTDSKHWRDSISSKLVGRRCTSSAKFQDNLFDENAVPPAALDALSEENIKGEGVVEAYIYDSFMRKHEQMKSIFDRCSSCDKKSFHVQELIESFRSEPGLKRSLDKIYEIIVFALFQTLTECLEMQVSISVDESKRYLLNEFGDFAKSIMQLDSTTLSLACPSRIYRVGVTNAADRGLDMYGNWGPVIQVKHLALDEDLANEIVDSVSSDRIVIVCKSADRGIILSLLTQIGWKARIQSIVTESDFIAWYEKALRGPCSKETGDRLLEILLAELKNEFPSLDCNDKIDFWKSRGYAKLSDPFWQEGTIEQPSF